MVGCQKWQVVRSPPAGRDEAQTHGMLLHGTQRMGAGGGAAGGRMVVLAVVLPAVGR